MKMKWIAALLMAGVMALSQEMVYGEELTGEQAVEEVLTSEDEIPLVGTEVIVVPDPVEIVDFVSPTSNTFMHSGDTYSVSFRITGTTELPENVRLYWTADCLDSNGNPQGKGCSIFFDLDTMTGNYNISSSSDETPFFSSRTLTYNKASMKFSFSTQIQKSKYYCLSSQYVYTYGIFKYGDPYVYIDDNCADGDHTIYSNTEATEDWRATCEEDGQKSKKCVKCGSIVEDTIKVIPKLGHDWKEVERIDPDGCKEGRVSYECQNCWTLKYDTLPATEDHNWQENYREEPNCTRDGYVEYYCDKCGQDKYDTLPATGEHNWNSYYTVDKEATRTEPGQKSIHCNDCGTIKEDSIVEIPKINPAADPKDTYVEGLEAPVLLETNSEKYGYIYGAGMSNYDPEEGDTRWRSVSVKSDQLRCGMYEWDYPRFYYGSSAGITVEKQIPLVFTLVEEKYLNDGWKVTGEEYEYTATVTTKAYATTAVFKGLDDPIDFSKEENHLFTIEEEGVGEGPYQEGDVRFVPVNLEFSTHNCEYEELTEPTENTVHEYSLTCYRYTNTEYKVTVTATLQECVYIGGKWVVQNSGERKYIGKDFTVLGHPDPTPTPTPSTPTPTPKPSQQEVIYIYVTPTPIPSDHDPYIPDINESTVTGLENPLVFTPGKYYRFKATGASAATKYESSTIGDGKWMPAFWSLDEAGEESEYNWKLGSDDGIEVGTHDLYVWFRLYKWDGTDWVATGRIEALKTNFTSTTLDPSPAPEKPLPAVTNLKATATGLKTVTLSWTASEGADGYIILGLNSAGRTGKQIGYTGATTWVDKAADSENWNYYWVLPYRKADGKLTLGALSNYAYALGRTVGAVLVLDAQATTTGVSLSWGRADNANSYVVLSKTGSATAPFNDPISTTGTTVKDTAAKPGEVKYYWVYGSYNSSSGKPMAVGKVSPFAWAVAK